jgi:histidinol phosphatase-like PHP family hydrolase
MLLADLHIHSTWSDGQLTIPELIDTFGRSGHDVIAITDHVVNTDNVIGKVTHRFGLTVTRHNFDAYRTEIDREAKRAWDEYRMIVIAGCELTRCNDGSPVEDRRLRLSTTAKEPDRRGAYPPLEPHGGGGRDAAC